MAKTLPLLAYGNFFILIKINLKLVKWNLKRKFQCSLLHKELDFLEQ